MRPPPYAREIASSRYADLSSPSLRAERQRLIDARRAADAARARLKEIEERISQTEKRIRRAEGPLRFLFGRRADEWRRLAHDLTLDQIQAEEEVDLSKKAACHSFSEADLAWVERVEPAFERLSRIDRIWDITHEGETHYRSSAGRALTRTPVQLYRGLLEEVHPTVRSFAFGNSNGPDLHLYPGLLAMVDGRGDLALIAFGEFVLDFATVRFEEEDVPPSDAGHVGFTWRYVNRDGSPDRRFADNPRIPVYTYGRLVVKSPSGLEEEYNFSDARAMLAFAEAIKPSR